MKIALFAFILLVSNFAISANVDFTENQLLLDGEAQPQLWGAELQYFRLRGGYEKNISREKVIALWNKALDRMVEAKMNTVSFYIPWDFHEYADGKYDFTGTVDEDKDGNADYPSRDIFTFFKLIEEHGIHRIMVRPGPYINAEWGFLGFGAVPKWFHEKFPDSHMSNRSGFRTRLYDYHNPDFLKYSERWFSVLYRDVLHKYMGPGKPIAFLQVDNETNYMWQSIWNHDYGKLAQDRYREFLKSRYSSIRELNASHGRSYADFSEVRPGGRNVGEDQDWYRFQDYSMYTYLQKVRAMWERLGVKEPTVLFTLAESYNAMKEGILPNYKYRNDQTTGLMTVNLYPKTYDLPSKPLYNLPFKTDHDVKAAETANDSYFGKKVEWVFGPEIQGGWWRGVDISEEAHRQTYLTVLGHGMKGLMIYYFHEGDNWGVEGAFELIKPVFDKIKSRAAYVNMSDKDLPQPFWDELQKTVTVDIMDGFDTRGLIMNKYLQEKELFFDAPLDHNAAPRDHFAGVKEIGTKFISPNEEFLGEAVEMEDPVCLLRESSQHAPTKLPNIDSLIVNGEWMGGLLGYLLQSGVNPRILHWGLTPESELDSCRILLRHDTAPVSVALLTKLKSLMQRGSIVVNLIGSYTPDALNLGVKTKTSVARGEWVSFLYEGTNSLFSAVPYFSYELPQGSACINNMYWNKDSVGYQCPVGQGTFVQVGAVFYGKFNTDDYASQNDVPAKRKFIEHLLRLVGVSTKLQIKEGGDRVSVFGRTNGKTHWVTVKSGQNAKTNFHVLVRDVQDAKTYEVKNLQSGNTTLMSGYDLKLSGVAVDLPANGSNVYTVTLK